MSPEHYAFILMLFAALFGALYSTVVKISADRVVLFAGMNAVHIPIGIVAAFFVPFPEAGAWPFILLSGVFYALSVYASVMSFSRADLSIVHPLKGAVGYVVVSALSIVIFSETLQLHQWLALAGVLAGILAQMDWKGLRTQNGAVAVMFCLVGGAMGAFQTISDFTGFDCVKTRLAISSGFSLSVRLLWCLLYSGTAWLLPVCSVSIPA